MRESVLWFDKVLHLVVDVYDPNVLGHLRSERGLRRRGSVVCAVRGLSGFHIFKNAIEASAFKYGEDPEFNKSVNSQTVIGPFIYNINRICGPECSV